MATTLLAVCCLGGWVAWEMRPKTSEYGTCTERLGTTCTDIPVAHIAKVSKIDLPEGTEVLDSRSQSFQDQRLTATLRLPAGTPTPFVLPDDVYGVGEPEGVDDSPTTSALAPHGVTTADAYEAEAAVDGMWHNAAVGTDAQGRVVIWVEVFST